MTVIELLEKLEWSGIGTRCCPTCIAPEGTPHKPECELARMLKLLKAEWADRDDEHTPAIRAVHPMSSNWPDVHGRYVRAANMIGNRNSKYALVDLVNWLLWRAERAEQALESLTVRVFDGKVPDTEKDIVRRAVLADAVVKSLRESVAKDMPGAHPEDVDEATAGLVRVFGHEDEEPEEP